MVQVSSHRVDTVLSFLSRRPNWDSPTPSHAGECVTPPPPPFGSVEEGIHSLAGEVVGGGVPIPTRGQTLSVGLYVLCGTSRLKLKHPSLTLSIFRAGVTSRVSFETSFDSKQPKLEPKLVSALSETKCLFRLFCFYTETESFGVSIEPKKTEDQPKQFDREHILVFFHKILCCFRLFRFVSVCFRLFRLFRILYQNSKFRCFDWTETNRRPTETVW